MRESLTRNERLGRKSDITRVFRRGRAVRCSGLQLRVVENGLDYNRVAFTCVRKFGSSVARNRAKRIAREIYRKRKGSLKTGYDLAFVLYPGEQVYRKKAEQFDSLLSQAGLLVYGE